MQIERPDKLFATTGRIISTVKCVLTISFSCVSIAAVLFSYGSTSVSPASLNSTPATQTPQATRPRTVARYAAGVPDLGPNASLHGKQVFPPDNPWNQDISNAPVDSNSAQLIAAIGANEVLHPEF